MSLLISIPKTGEQIPLDGLLVLTEQPLVSVSECLW
jgi:hypothetical protein